MSFQVTATAAATAVSQELSPFGLALGVSRPGTKYPVRGIPYFDLVVTEEDLILAVTQSTATAAAAVSQELWNLGRALVQRAQEPNIPCGESLTSTKSPLEVKELTQVL